MMKLKRLSFLDKTLKKKKKRHFTLIEVLIAFFILLLCFFPLLYPHVYMLQEQRAFIDKVELDQKVNLLYGKIVCELYENKIAWEDLLHSQEFEIQDHISGYTGTYRFEKKLIKVNKDHGEQALLTRLIFTFKPKNPQKQKPLSYEYLLFIKKGKEGSLS